MKNFCVKLVIGVFILKTLNDRESSTLSFNFKFLTLLISNFVTFNFSCVSYSKELFCIKIEIKLKL